jgi:hypothetical protein
MRYKMEDGQCNCWLNTVVRVMRKNRDKKQTIHDCWLNKLKLPDGPGLAIDLSDIDAIDCQRLIINMKTRRTGQRWVLRESAAACIFTSSPR